MSGVIAWMTAEADSGQGLVVSGQSETELPGADEDPCFSQNGGDPSTSLRGGVGHPPVSPPFENREGWGSPPSDIENPHFSQNRGEVGHPREQPPGNLPAHQFPQPAECSDAEQERRIYRGRTVAMLRRYMRYSIETGRLPSLLGREFFRAKVTQYTVVTFEDRVIFVYDMEMCLERLDEFSRQIIARHILQEHDQAATGRLLHCTERTVRTYIPIALDLLSDILLEAGLLERVAPVRENSCQGGPEGEILVSDCEDGKNKF